MIAATNAKFTSQLQQGEKKNHTTESPSTHTISNTDPVHPLNEESIFPSSLSLCIMPQVRNQEREYHDGGISSNCYSSIFTPIVLQMPCSLTFYKPDDPTIYPYLVRVRNHCSCRVQRNIVLLSFLHPATPVSV
jgi:hypothetical protein